MQLKILLKWLLFAVGIEGIIFFLIIIFFPNLFSHISYAKSTPPTSIQVSQSVIDGSFIKNVQAQSVSAPTKQSSPAIPIRIQIPTIKVNAIIESAGLTAQGAVAVPKGPANVAWFNLGPRPGEIGKAIINGHYGRWKNGIPTVFNNLPKLRKGDKIYIKDDKGVTTAFVVRELKTYDLKTNASEVFISNDGKSHLNLITCLGVWNKITKSYSKRLVVFADKEE